MLIVQGITTQLELKRFPVESKWDRICSSQCVSVQILDRVWNRRFNTHDGHCRDDASTGQHALDTSLQQILLCSRHVKRAIGRASRVSYRGLA